MAGYALPGPAHQLALQSSNQPLPTGPCSHSDVATGACGCEQFWDKTSADLHQGSKDQRSSEERSTWCMCGHHACFHKASMAAALPRAPAGCDGRCRLHSTAHCEIHKSTSLRRDERPSREGSLAGYNGRLKTSHASPSQRSLRIEASQANGPGQEQEREAPSQPSTSSLPRVPSMCLLSNDRRSTANSDARNGTNQSRQTVAGLGLSLMNLGATGASIERQQSVTSTVPDDIEPSRAPDASHSEPDIPSTRANSVAGEQGQLTSPAPGLDAILEYNRSLHLDVSGDTIPNTFNLEDFIQSATEVATPSNANTPDLAIADKDVHEGKRIIESVMQLTSNLEQHNSVDGRRRSATSVPAPQLSLANSPNVAQEHLHNVIKSASPQTLQKILSYLAPLHNLLNSMPNVANTLSELNDRLALLENNSSFNFVHPDDLQQQFDGYDGRLIELENRMDDHDRLHQMIDADNSSHSLNRRRIANVSDSFGSNASLQSTTSSALILAAMDRKDMETELGSIKDRLEVLEATAVPTLSNPWEVEVVLLPWGRDLRGIWFSPDEPMHDSSKGTTQDSEEWTQARSSIYGQSRASLGPLRDTDSSPHHSGSRSSRSSHPFSDSEGGWSSQAISEWASGSSDGLLSPKACGTSGLVYKRLKSRGFVKNITFTSANAKDIQVTLSQAFIDMLEHLKYTEEDEDPAISSYPGLRASFIPLRKVARDSRLRFLTPAEMASSALWSAQFLASGVIMRVTGGTKRLYVTQREAYIQAEDEIGSSWTWQELRELPRIRPDTDSQMEGNEAQCQPQVAEADAREACWAFCEAYDAPPLSVNASFESHQSAQLSLRPADRQWRRSMTPNSILKNRYPQPISPLSEAHPQRPFHNRTVSASMVEPAASSSSKRRLNSSPVKQSSAPHASSRAPSISMVRLKRRRVSNSHHLDLNVGADRQEAQAALWANTPRRSREPPSPFYSSDFRLPRTNSDLTSRPSQRSVAAVGKSTPFAYATPHSGAFIDGPGFGGGDTEADEHVYQDDDGDQSWRGVGTGDDDDNSGSEDDAEAGAEDEPASFSGDDSALGTEDVDDDSSSAEEEDDYGAQRPGTDDEEEEEEDVFDSLLDAIEGRESI